jgi:hypothetical protein
VVARSIIDSSPCPRDVVAHDPRPSFLYLRSFDEDRLKLRVSLERRGILELLAPLRRRRFEEVLVRALSAYGPVIAPTGATQSASRRRWRRR